MHQPYMVLSIQLMQLPCGTSVLHPAARNGMVVGVPVQMASFVCTRWNSPCTPFPPLRYIRHFQPASHRLSHVRRTIVERGQRRKQVRRQHQQQQQHQRRRRWQQPARRTGAPQVHQPPSTPRWIPSTEQNSYRRSPRRRRCWRDQLSFRSTRARPRHAQLVTVLRERRRDRFW